MSGDATIVDTGAITIAAGAVTLAKLADIGNTYSLFNKDTDLLNFNYDYYLEKKSNSMDFSSLSLKGTRVRGIATKLKLD